MKNSKQNFLIGFTAVAIAFGFFGCNKFLDRKPLGGAIEGDVAQGAVEEQVFGLYAATKNWGMTQLPFLMMNSARSDDADKGSTETDGADVGDIVDNFHYTKDHWMLNAYWDDHYGFISLANNVLQAIDSLKLTDETSIINEAEAKFLRAWAFFDLVRTYGEVPKLDFKVYKPEDANIAKSSVDDIYALIDEDLSFAEANLPLSWESKYIGRSTKGAAMALHAKTYLYRQNWGAALSKCEEVIGSGQYELYVPYSGLFTENAENSKESIFEIQNFENSNGTLNYSNAVAQYQGVRGSGDWDLGWGWNAPNQSLVDAYETGDPREAATILFSGQSDGIYGQVVPASPPLARPYWNKKVYTDPARRAQTGDRFGLWLNTMIIRYADVLLMAAEAANELGGEENTTKALDYLEQVRARARNGNNAILPPVTITVQSELRDAIRHERRVEFGMEYERFFDLVRWGIAKSTFAAMGVTFEDRNKYYPIPQEAIDKSGGKLVQNPDYP